jgi:S-adenosylhomocysteine hydrolase
MLGLMAAREEFSTATPLTGMNISGSLHMTTQTVDYGIQRSSHECLGAGVQLCKNALMLLEV